MNSTFSHNNPPRPKYGIGQCVIPVESNPEWVQSKIIDIKYYNKNMGWAYKIETKNTHLDSLDSWFWEKEINPKMKKKKESF